MPYKLPKQHLSHPPCPPDSRTPATRSRLNKSDSESDEQTCPTLSSFPSLVLCVFRKCLSCSPSSSRFLYWADLLRRLTYPRGSARNTRFRIEGELLHPSTAILATSPVAVPRNTLLGPEGPRDFASIPAPSRLTGSPIPKILERS